VKTIDRLAPTLQLLGYPVTLVFWSLGVAFVLAAALHLAAVWTAEGKSSTGARPCRHPLLTGGASLLVPGWGQVLNGDRMRAMLFLGGCWFVAAAWILASRPATDLFNTYLPVVAPWEGSVRAPLVLWTLKWTAPVVVWSLAIYDAAASASSRKDR